MSDSGSRSWDDVIAALRGAVGDLRDAIGRSGPSGVDEHAATVRLKDDVARLEQNASDLVTKIASGLEERRGEVESSFDREQVERSAGQVRTSLEELASLTTALASSVAAAAGSSIKQAEPELKEALRSLEDVAASAAAWARATIDPGRDQRGNLSSEGRPPLEDF
jgi:hypothetical protein